MADSHLSSQVVHALPYVAWQSVRARMNSLFHNIRPKCDVAAVCTMTFWPCCFDVWVRSSTSRDAPWCTARKKSPLRMRRASPEESLIRKRSQQPRSHPHPRYPLTACRRQNVLARACGKGTATVDVLTAKMSPPFWASVPALPVSLALIGAPSALMTRSFSSLTVGVGTSATP